MTDDTSKNEKIYFTPREALEQEFILLHGGNPDPPIKTISDAEDVDKQEQERMKQLFSQIHEKNQAALCLSGGGIRSATFNLGIIQGLAKAGWLERFHYLSTVSGGGFIGAWLSSWIHQNNDDPREVIKGLTEFEAGKIKDPESQPIRFLRSYSNYLTPKVGLFSTDTWTLAGIILRNLFLNWLVLMPIFLAVLMVPRFYGTIIKTGLFREPFFFIGFAAAFFIFSLGYVGCDLPSLGNGKNKQNSFLLCFFLPFVLSIIFFTIGWARLVNMSNSSPSLYVLMGIGALLYGSGSIFAIVAFLYAKKSSNGGITSLPYGKGCENVESNSFPRRPLLMFVATIVCGAIGGFLAYFAVSNLFAVPTDDRLYACLAVPVLTGIFMIVGIFFVGLTSKVTTDDDREWLAQSGAWILLFAVVWGMISCLDIFGPSLIHKYTHTAFKTLFAATGGISGLITALAGFSSKTSAKSGVKASSSQILNLALKIGPVVFVVTLPVLLSMITSLLLKDNSLFELRNFGLWSNKIVFSIIVVALALGAGIVTDINKFSLHAMYRNRLVRAFLGATNLKRKPHMFTDFDPDDNIAMKALPDKPLHVINVTLNLVSSENKNSLAWQQRKAESFTITKLHSGSSRLGYRTSDRYGKGNRKPISLGTAVAISGAAVSPDMGYYSSPLITFIMALFNLRFGWWLGNPAKEAGRKTWNREGPRFSVGPLINETFGRTNDTSKYVYLSDGGHFENLGLYEMVYRRCKLIVVSDASCDPSPYGFEDLGNAIRKIRIDLGIDIEINLNNMCWKDGKCESDKCIKEHPVNFAPGTIDYSKVDGNGKKGHLIYIKPVFCGKVSTIDVYNYRKLYNDFPHQSTADQWFDESQFESYRILGLKTVEAVDLLKNFDISEESDSNKDSFNIFY